MWYIQSVAAARLHHGPWIGISRLALTCERLLEAHEVVKVECEETTLLQQQWSKL